MYVTPDIRAGANATAALKDLPGTVLVTTMDVPWALFRKHLSWEPDHIHMVTDMDLATLERLQETLPPCDAVVGLGGGSSCDTAKYLAWKRGCRMVLVPTIVSVDAPLTNMIAARVDGQVRYVGDIWPRELILDYALIQQAPKELNRAGACDIASIHTALFDWKLAHDDTGEAYDAAVVAMARECLEELDRCAEDVYRVTPKGIDTIIGLFKREVAFCASIGTSRPEEGSEHIVAYCIEHETKRHFLHGDLVGLGIFAMARLQNNAPEWITGLIRRCGLRYTAPDATREEVRRGLENLRSFKEKAGLFYSVVDTAEITGAFLDETLAALDGD